MMPMISRLLPPAAAFFFLCGCSGAKPPTALLSNAELGVRAADEAKANQLAPVDFKNAQDKLARAKQAMAAERYEEARRLAESAQVDAELAQAKADAEVMRRAADQVLRKGDPKGDLPPTEAERESRRPLNSPPEKE
jgi:Domain of unknown function (DUF4398)